MAIAHGNCAGEITNIGKIAVSGVVRVAAGRRFTDWSAWQGGSVIAPLRTSSAIFVDRGAPLAYMISTPNTADCPHNAKCARQQTFSIVRAWRRIDGSQKVSGHRRAP